MKHLLKIYIWALLLSAPTHLFGQCMNLINIPGDTVGWKRGSSRSRGCHYQNDTFVISNATMSENNYIYNAIPVAVNGIGSSFTASFDFMIDSNNWCSDGLTFWFLTSSLYGLGSTSKEGGSLGFPDTVSGFALALRTISCVDQIYLKRINATHYSWSGGSGTDTNICPYLDHQMFLTDSTWHHCVVNYDHGFISASFDGGRVKMGGFSPLYGIGHFGFMATNGAGYSRKRLKNIQVCAGLGTPTFANDTFGTDLNRQCNGPLMSTTTRGYSPTYELHTQYGDGTHDSTAISPAFGCGYASFSHAYAAPGTFAIKQKLYDAGTLLDSLSFTYDNVFCATLPVRFFYDANGNGLYEPGEAELGRPILTEVDSNGVPVDTISSTGGFYYKANGSIGDVYSFRVISDGLLNTTTPASGTIYDSLVPGIFIYPIKYFGMTCGSSGGFDLSVRALIPVTGIHDQWADIYVQNTGCAAMSATLQLNYSSKYAGMPTQISPPAISAVPGIITWNLSSLSSAMPAPKKLHYEGEHGTIPVPIGDTVHTRMVISPMISDVDTTNNIFIKVDTVRAGCDPNAIWVIPDRCFASGADPIPLEYDIHFENTGNDTAHNIYVLDTLSDHLDVSTMRIVLASHKMYVSNWKDAAGRTIVKFDFPQIKLLDSSHHGLCDGAVMYSIKTKGGLPDGTEIKNRAGIYFDVNDVVMTNDVSTGIGCPETGVATLANENNTRLYPNPTKGELTITTTMEAHTLSVCDLIGRTRMTKKCSGNTNTIDVSTLTPGIYMLRINDTEIRRFVKE